MRAVLATVQAAVAVLLLCSAGAATAADREDLTGKWFCDDGGTYYLRQVGDDLWWTGRSGEPKGEKKAFANVFHGTIHGNKVTGSWVDDPAGESRSAGTLTLEIVGEGKHVELRKKDDTGGFSGGVWTTRK